MSVNPRLDWLVQHYDSLPSTMDRAALLARAGARERTAVVAAEQTAGRGRAGRVWQSGPGHALTCTLILRPAVPAARLAALSLTAGVAVAEAIESLTAMPAQLKWPNDVWLGNDPERRKVAGILLTSSLTGSTVEAVLIGVGINVSTPLDALPPKATSILAASGRETRPHDVLTVLLGCFDHGYEAFLDNGGRPSLAAWRRRAALLGEQVTIEDGGRIAQGIFAGVDDDGSLLLSEGTGEVRRIVSGDLVRGPRPVAQSG